MVAHALSVPHSTRSLGVDTASVQADTASATPVTIDFGGEPVRTVVVRVFEVGISSASEPHRKVTKSANAEMTFKRLTVQRERLALVDRQLARWTPMQEEVQLEAARAELETRRPSPIP